MVASAQIQTSPQFVQLSTRNGLAQDTVNSIATDGKGRVWIGSESGLQFWDGNKLHSPKGISEEGISLQNILVTRVSVNESSIWIGTSSSGLLLYKPHTNQISLVDKRTYASEPGSVQSIVDLHQTQTKGLLVASHESVFYVDKDTGDKTELFSLSITDSQRYLVIRAIELVDDQLFIAASDGLVVKNLNDTDSPPKQLRYLPQNQISEFSQITKAFHVSGERWLWIGTAQGLYIADVQALQCETLRCNFSRPVQTALPDRDIWTIVAAKNSANDKIWIGSDMGLYATDTKLYAGKKPAVEHIFQPQVGTIESAKKHVYSIVEDDVNNLWLGTHALGALYWLPDSLLFSTIHNSIEVKDQEPVLADNTVWSIKEMPSGQLWIGTEGGLTNFDLLTGRSVHYLRSQAASSFNQSQIHTVALIDESRLMLETPLGLLEFDISKKAASIPSAPQDYVYGLRTDSEGRAYYIGKNLFRYNPDLSSVDIVKQGEKSPPISDTFSFLGEASALDGDMLFAAVNGIWRLNKETLRITLLHELALSSQAANVIPSSFVFTPTSLWVAYTGYGLVELDRNTLVTKSLLTPEHGLPNNMVYGLLADDSNNIWFSSNSGIHRVSYDDKRLTNFRYGKHLTLSEFNEGAAHKLADGRLAFGSPNGVLIFDPEKINTRLNAAFSKAVTPRLSNLALASRDNVANVFDEATNHIQLEHDDVGLRLNFSAMRTDISEDISMEYRLLRKKRVVSSGIAQNGEVDFALLSAGDYDLVLLQNPLYNVVDLQPLRLTINVPYAPFRSPTAYAAYAFTLLLALVLFGLYRNRQTRRLAFAEQQNRLFGESFKQTRDAVVIYSSDLSVVAANPAFLSSYAAKRTGSAMQQVTEFAKQVPIFQTKVVDFLKHVAQGEHFQTEQKWSLPDGREFDVIVDVTAVPEPDNEATRHYLVVISDVSEQKGAERKLQRIASYDNLTGLVNRSLLADRLEHAVANAREHDTKMAVLFIDLDRFKGINDTLGHAIGDKLLRVIATRMRNLATPSDTVARLGGDEFVVIAEDIESPEKMAFFSKQLIETIEMPIVIDNESLSLSCSIGIALFPDDGTSSAELLRNADVAMYAAKKNTLTAFQFFTKQLNEQANQRLRLENAVKKLQQNDEFFNMYQPIIDAREGHIVGLEMLMRAQVDSRPISPADFVPVLEELRQIVDVTNVALARAIKDLVVWYDLGYRGYVSINLSALHFVSEFKFMPIKALLERNNLPVDSLRFEITESVLLEDQNRAQEVISDCKKEGFFLMLDDFGTGYSSLSYLKTFILDGLKIDKSFIDDLGTNQRSDALINATVNLASSLDMFVIAEGVETVEQARALATFECHFLQGYFFSKPQLPQQISEIIHNHYTIE